MDYKEMFRAIAQKDINAVKELIKNGYDIDVMNPLGETALFKAVVRNNFEIVDVLLSCNPDFDIIYEKRYYILHAACQHPTIPSEIIGLLLNRGCDANKQDANGNPAIWYIVGLPKPNVQILRLLLDHKAKIDITNKDNKSALSIAINRDKKEVLEIFSQYGLI